MSSIRTISERLDGAPIGPFHRRLATAVGAGLFVDGFDVYLAAGVASALVKQEGASLKFAGAFAASGVLGLAVGGLAAGFIADRIGRRRTLQITMLIVLIGSLAAAFAPSLPLLLVFRTIATLGLGGEPVLGYATLIEFLPPRKRGRWQAWMGLLGNIGMPLALLVGGLVLPMEHGWRFMLALPALAALPVFWLRRNFPESPRWLVARGRDGEADRIVQSIEREISIAQLPLAEAAAPARPQEAPLPASIAVRMTVACAINIAVICAVFGFVSWLPTFFVTEGRTVAKSVVFAGIIAIGVPAGVLIGLLAVERIERKWSFVAGCAAIVVLGIGYMFARTDAEILGAGFLVATAIYFTGAVGITSYVPELFPTAMRMRGVGIAATVGRAVAMILPLPVVWLLQWGGQHAVLALILAIIAIQALLVARFGIESNGRSLESI